MSDKIIARVALTEEEYETIRGLLYKAGLDLSSYADWVATKELKKKAIESYIKIDQLIRKLDSEVKV